MNSQAAECSTVLFFRREDFLSTKQTYNTQVHEEMHGKQKANVAAKITERYILTGNCYMLTVRYLSSWAYYNTSLQTMELRHEQANNPPVQ